MSGHDYPENVAVDWCIDATIMRPGRPLRHNVMGTAEAATADVIDWLETLDGNLGDKPRVKVVATLTSEQLPGWEHEVTSSCVGMPASEAIEYSVDWLAKVAVMQNWGGGGS